MAARRSLDTLLDNDDLFIIDGSMSTLLEQNGANLNNRLWTASILAESPEQVERVHYAYLEAGADCGITCSYQASIPGFTAAGYTGEQAEALIASSVQVFLNARDRWWAEQGERAGRKWPLCLGACGPYGAYLADGSEYRGHYGVSDEVLRAFHTPRARILWESGADILLFETQPSLYEVLIEAEIAESLGADYWVSLSCKDEEHTCEGDLVRECAAQLSVGHPHLKMIGVNCTKPEYIESLILELRKGTDLPIGVYPNSGEEYDPVTKTWHGSAGSVSFGDYAFTYYRAGASAVGGCCTTVVHHIREVAAAKERYLAGEWAGAPDTHMHA